MPSLKSIADELGVSYTLVSKVLSGRMGTTGASAKTRDAILSKARELDYKPNHLAVALKSGRKGAIGVFLHHTGAPSSEITDQFLRGLSSALEKTNTRMWLRFFVRDKEFLTACDEHVQREVDGLIVAGAAHVKLIDKLREIDAQGLPIVAAFDYVDPANRAKIVSAGTDYVMQTYLTTRHLLELGCRRLAHLFVMESRYQGFLRAHQELGVQHDPSLVLKYLNHENWGWDSGTGAEGARHLLRDGLVADGLVCQSDAQAFGAINYLTSHGVSVPSQFKVTGVDDSPLAAISQIPITSVSSGMRELGVSSVDLLLRRIAGERVESVTILPKLAVRASSVG